MPTDLSTAIDYFKMLGRQSLHQAVVLVGQMELQRVLAVFSTMPLVIEKFDLSEEWSDVDFSDPDSIPEMRARLLWDELWNHVGISFETYSERVMMPVDDVERRFEVLKAARMVFPDGTISPIGANILRATVAKSIPAPVRSPKKKEPATSGKPGNT